MPRCRVNGDKENRRQRDRVPQKYKITFPSLEVLKDNYLVNIGTGGVFIQSKKPFIRGARFDLRIFLPDEPKPLDVYCEVGVVSRTRNGLLTIRNFLQEWV